MIFSEFLRSQLDYIFFFYGLSFIVLSGICFNLSRKKGLPTGLQWKWLALFGLLHGVNEWLDLLAISLGDNDLFTGIRTTVMALSFVFLFEFGRRGVRGAGAKLAGYWLYIPVGLIAFSGATYGASGLNATMRYGLGFTGGLLTALSFFVAGRKNSPSSAGRFIMPGLLSLGYAAATGLVVPAANFFPAFLLNHDGFWAWSGIPIQLIRGFLAMALAIVLWNYLESCSIKGNLPTTRRFLFTRRKSVAGAFLIIILFGWLITNALHLYAHNNLLTEHRNDTFAIRQLFHFDFRKVDQAVRSLSGGTYILPALKTPSPETIANVHSLLDRYRRSFDFSVCYLLDTSGNVLASTNRDAPGSFLGQNYSTRQYFQAALSGKPGKEIAIGRTSGIKGYYSAYPCLDASGKIAGIVAIKLNLTSAIFPHHHPSLLIDPYGIVFLSNQSRYESRALWPLDAETQEKVLGLHLYPRVNFSPTLVRKAKNADIIHLNKSSYYFFSEPIDIPGWFVAILANTHTIREYRLAGINTTILICLIFIVFLIALRQREDTLAMLVQEMNERKQIAEMLQKSQQMLRLVLDHMPARIFWKDRNLQYIGCNNSCARDAGLASPEMIIGKTDFDLAWSLNASKYRADDILVIKTNQPKLDYEEKIVSSDGRVFWARTSKLPLHGSDGEVSGVVGIYDDITARKLAEESLQEREATLAAIASSARDAILMMNPEGRISFWNNAAERILGWSRDEALGKDLHEFLAPQRYHEAFHHAFAHFQATGQGAAVGKNLELHALKKDGSEITIELSLSSVLLAGHWNAVAILRDITERKRAELELARSNAELEQFAYVASHDLQEPLRMVTSYVQLLAKRYQGKLDQDAHDFIGFAVEGATRMHLMINDLLDYSRVMRHTLEFEPVDSGQALQKALSNLEIAIQESGAVITHESLPIVMADHTQLMRLFQNLIANAIKFRSEKAPEIHVHAELKDNQWIFSVRDNGIGFEPQYAERIFAIFQRLHTHAHYPGSGIGLAVCKKIVDRHGGRIWAESSAGHGSTFYFTVPQKGAY
jgi:PAS domain S-box-containing protein